MSAIRTAAVAPAARGSRLDYKWVAAGVVVIGALMSVLNQTVITVALPTLENDFGVRLTDIQWVVTGYALGLAAVIPLSGWLCDRYGTKRVFFVSQVLFTASSVLCGLAWSNGSLIAFRVVQGLAGGLVMPVGMTILMSASRPEERGRMMATLGLPMMVGPILGPTLGGYLVQYVTWRLIFFVNVPVGVVGAVMTALFLRGREGGPERHPLDVAGLLLATPAVVAIVYGLSQPSAYGWFSVQTLAPLLAGVATLVVFCVVEARRSSPLIDIRVFRDAAFTASMTLNFFIGVALFGSVLLVPLFLQQLQGYSALDAGVLLAAQGLAAAAAMPFVGVLVDRFGARSIVPIGLTLLTGASFWMTTLSPGTPRATVALMVAARGFGMGLSMMPSMSSAYVTLAPALIARATAISNTVQRIAAGLGAAIVATILSERIRAHLPHVAGGLPQGGSGNLAGLHLPAAVKAVLLAQAAKGFDDAFWVTAGLSLVCFPMALLLRRALRPSVVRGYALKQLAEGIILGAAARRLRDGEPAGLDADYESLSGAADSRLRRGLQVLRAGTNASGLVPQPALSLVLKAAFVVLMIVALTGTVLTVAHGYGSGLG